MPRGGHNREVRAAEDQDAERCHLAGLASGDASLHAAAPLGVADSQGGGVLRKDGPKGKEVIQVGEMCVREKQGRRDWTCFFCHALSYASTLPTLPPTSWLLRDEGGAKSEREDPSTQ